MRCVDFWRLNQRVRRRRVPAGCGDALTDSRKQQGGEVSWMLVDEVSPKC